MSSLKVYTQGRRVDSSSHPGCPPSRRVMCQGSRPNSTYNPASCYWAFWEAAQDDSSGRVHGTHEGHPDVVPAFCLSLSQPQLPQHVGSKPDRRSRSPSPFFSLCLLNKYLKHTHLKSQLPGLLTQQGEERTMFSFFFFFCNMFLVPSPMVIFTHYKVPGPLQ